jgi:hypothetical protein
MTRNKVLLIAALITSLSVVVGFVAAEKDLLIDESQAERMAAPRYQFSKKYRSQWALPKVLHEVSGIAVLDDQKLLIHHDEAAVVFRFDLDTQVVTPRFALGEPALNIDVEGIASMAGDVYLVTSMGEIYEVPDGVNRTGVIKDYVVFDTGLKDVCEIEGLARDLQSGSLVLACKQMLDKNAEYISIYRFTPGSEKTEKLFDISFGSTGRKVHATAIASRPGGYIVLFGKEKLIGRLDSQGTILELQALKKKWHPQPEGLGLLKDDRLVLADEGKKAKGRLTVYQAID